MITTPLSLILRLKEPDNQLAWQEFVAIYAPLLAEFGRRLELPEEDAADIAQELFIVLLRRMQTFDYDRSKSFRGFLWTCYLNLARRWYRERKGYWPPALESASEDHPLMEEREFQQYVMARALQVMQRRFEEKTWRTYVEYELHGRTAREVEQMLQVPESYVYVYTARVRSALRTELGGMLD